jgi:hypothetical protein
LESRKVAFEVRNVSFEWRKTRNPGKSGAYSRDSAMSFAMVFAPFAVIAFQ